MFGLSQDNGVHLVGDKNAIVFVTAFHKPMRPLQLARALAQWFLTVS